MLFLYLDYYYLETSEKPTRFVIPARLTRAGVLLEGVPSGSFNQQHFNILQNRSDWIPDKKRSGMKEPFSESSIY